MSPGSPVSGARVMVEGLGHDVVTSPRGEFWRLLSPGSYTIMARQQGARSRPVPVTVREGAGAQVVNLVHLWEGLAIKKNIIRFFFF